MVQGPFLVSAFSGFSPQQGCYFTAWVGGKVTDHRRGLSGWSRRPAAGFPLPLPSPQPGTRRLLDPQAAGPSAHPRLLSPALRWPPAGLQGPRAAPTAGAPAAGTGRPAQLPASEPGLGPPTLLRTRRPRGPWRLRTRCRGLEPTGAGRGGAAIGSGYRGGCWGRRAPEGNQLAVPPSGQPRCLPEVRTRGLWVGGSSLGRACWAGSLGEGGTRRAQQQGKG